MLAVRRRSQVVRQRSAKPLFIGSIPIAASKTSIYSSVSATTYFQHLRLRHSWSLPCLSILFLILPRPVAAMDRPPRNARVQKGLPILPEPNFQLRRKDRESPMDKIAMQTKPGLRCCPNSVEIISNAERSPPVFARQIVNQSTENRFGRGDLPVVWDHAFANRFARHGSSAAP